MPGCVGVAAPDYRGQKESTASPKACTVLSGGERSRFARPGRCPAFRRESPMKTCCQGRRYRFADCPAQPVPAPTLYIGNRQRFLFRKMLRLAMQNLRPYLHLPDRRAGHTTSTPEWAGTQHAAYPQASQASQPSQNRRGSWQIGQSTLKLSNWEDGPLASALADASGSAAPPWRTNRGAFPLPLPLPFPLPFPFPWPMRWSAVTDTG